MQKYLYTLDGPLQGVYKAEANKKLAKRIRNAKPTLNMNCPESFTHFKRQLHKSQERNDSSNYIKIFYYLV